MGTCDVGTIEAAGGDTHGAWCRCKFPDDPDMLAQCLRDFCANPMGCSNSDSGRPFPFDANPGLLQAPWTEIGGGTRGLPRVTTLLSAAAGVVNIDPKEFEPLNLWKTWWTNTARFYLILAKMQVIPALGQIYAVIAANPISLAPFAITQALQQNKDLGDYILKPALVGGPDQVGFVLRATQDAVGGRFFHLAGMSLQKVCADSVKDGSFEKTMPPNPNDPGVSIFRAVWYFFANNGERLGNDVQSAVDKGGGVAKDDTFWKSLGNAFTSLGKTTDFTLDARNTFTLLGKAFKSTACIVDGINNSDDPMNVADCVGNAVIPGFHVIAVLNAVKAGAGAVKASVSNVQLDSLADASTSVSKVGSSIGGLVSALQSANQKLGGGLEELIKEFTSALNLFGAMQENVSNALFIAAGSAKALVAQNVSQRTANVIDSSPVIRSAPAAVASRVANSAARTGIVVKTLPKPPAVVVGVGARPGQSPAPRGVTMASSPSSTSLLLGAGAGFLLGGPVGAAIGAAAGALAGRSAPSMQMSRFAGFSGPIRPLALPLPGDSVSVPASPGGAPVSTGISKLRALMASNVVPRALVTSAPPAISSRPIPVSVTLPLVAHGPMVSPVYVPPMPHEISTSPTPVYVAPPPPAAWRQNVQGRAAVQADPFSPSVGGGQPAATPLPLPIPFSPPPYVPGQSSTTYFTSPEVLPSSGSGGVMPSSPYTGGGGGYTDPASDDWGAGSVDDGSGADPSAQPATQYMVQDDGSVIGVQPAPAQPAPAGGIGKLAIGALALKLLFF